MFSLAGILQEDGRHGERAHGGGQRAERGDAPRRVPAAAAPGGDDRRADRKPAADAVRGRLAHSGQGNTFPYERIFIELMTSGRKLKASREGSNIP